MDINTPSNTYIDNIDNLFDDAIDKLYIHINKENSKLSNDDIRKLIATFITKYSKANMTDKTPEIKALMIEMLEQYSYFYTLVYISLRVKDFTQFVLSFKKDSTFNSVVIQTRDLVNNVFYLYKNDSNIRSGNITLDSSYADSVHIYNSLTNIFVDSANVKDIRHSVIKYILYSEYFIPKHKPELFVKIEILELEQSNTRMIEIVRSVDSQVDFTSIERLVGRDVNNGVLTDIYDMMSGEETDDDEFVIDRLTAKGKMNIAFKRLILVPIVDDFLRLNKNTESYDNNTNINPNVRVNKKNNTKIRYILGKMNDVLDYNKSGDVKVFHPPEIQRKAVLINHMEELDIIRKLQNVHNKTDDQITQLDDLMSLRKYPYQNFRDSLPSSFCLGSKNAVPALRYSGIEHKKKIPGHFNIEWRVVNKEMCGDVVGLALTSNNDLHVHMHNLVEAKVKEHTAISSILARAKKMIVSDDNTSQKVYYWIFDRTKDLDKRFVEIDSMSSDDYYRSVIEYIIDEISDLTYEKIINVLETTSNLSMYEMFGLANCISKSAMPLSKKRQHELINYIYNKVHIAKVEDDPVIIPGLQTKLVPLSNQKSCGKISKDEIINVDATEEGTLYNSTICQHVITYNRIMELRMRHPNKYNDKLQEFIKEFVIENTDKEFVCKSCSQYVKLKKYISDWTSTTEEGITLTLSLQTSLEKIAEYEKYSISIKNIGRIMEKFASAIGMSHLSGSGLSNEMKRQGIIKNMIDVINLQYEKIITLNSEKSRRARLEDSMSKYGISPQLTQFFLFELKNEIFTFSSKEVDKFKKSKLNNIVAYVILWLIVEINNGSIRNIPNDKLLNYYVFEKIGINMFNNINIRVNMANDVTPIINYKLLCYVIFILSGITVKYNMWFGDQPEKKSIINAQAQKMVIHTVIDAINDILDTNTTTDGSKYVYDLFAKRFFRQLRTEYSGDIAKESIKIIGDSVNKKIVITSGNKLIFKATPEKEIMLQPYTELSDFGPVVWPRHFGTSFRSFRYTVTMNEIMSQAQIDKLNKKRKSVSPVLKNYAKKPAHRIVYDHVDRGDFYTYIEASIKKWEAIIGKDAKIDGTNLYLRHTVYHVDHDYRGNKLDEPYVILNKDKSISFKKNDPQFKTNVYLFHNKKNDVHMYYNSQSYEYLGYRSGDNYITVYGTNNNLKPTFSVLHMLLFLGHTHMNYSIDEDIQEIIDKDVTLENYKLHKFIADIVKVRIQNVKNVLFSIQRVLNQMIFDKKKKSENLAAKFANKFKNIDVRDDKGKIFSDINEVTRSLYYKKIPADINIVFNKDYLYAADIIKLDNADHQLILYMCNEFNRFVEMNSSEHSKINIIYLISKIIEEQYKSINYREVSMNYSDVKKFIKMESNLYLRSETNQIDIFSNLNDEEAAKLKEELYSEEEAQGAYDVDEDLDDVDDEGEQLADTFRD